MRLSFYRAFPSVPSLVSVPQAPFPVHGMVLLYPTTGRLTRSGGKVQASRKRRAYFGRPALSVADMAILRDCFGPE
jgi:hypothetical protein